MSELLQIDGLSKRFQGLVAVDQVSFTVSAGTIHGLIGPNGAGKTTVFNLISGILPADQGRVLLQGRELQGLPLHARSAVGIARTFQNIRMFGEMSVLENVMTGMHSRLRAPGWQVTLRLPRFREEERAAKEESLALLEFVGLAGVADATSAELAYGDQRRLEIARALAGAPQLLLLDEPAAGMNPAETRELALLLRRVRDRGTTLLLVEHDMAFVMELCERITVLNFGRKIAEGPPQRIRENPDVISAYLGKKAAERLAGKAAS